MTSRTAEIGVEIFLTCGVVFEEALEVTNVFKIALSVDFIAIDNLFRTELKGVFNLVPQGCFTHKLHHSGLAGLINLRSAQLDQLIDSVIAVAAGSHEELRTDAVGINNVHVQRTLCIIRQGVAIPFNNNLFVCFFNIHNPPLFLLTIFIFSPVLIGGFKLKVDRLSSHHNPAAPNHHNASSWHTA